MDGIGLYFVPCSHFAIFGAGAGYKSAMQLLQEAQPAAGRAAHKSALELLREVPWWLRVGGGTSDHLPQSELLPLMATRNPRKPGMVHFTL